MLYYIDTCIWLNLFKKEGDPAKGIPYWKTAKEFIDRIITSPNDKIIYSSTILRELQIHLGEQSYLEKRKLLEKLNFLKIEVLKEDMIAARKLESKYNFEIGFYDILHMTAAKRLGAILVTRDALLIKIARQNEVCTHTPEEL